MTDSRFSCFLIGADTLLMECGNMLLEQGHDVRGVITSEPRIAAWASDRSLRVVDAKGDYGAALAEEPFEYLFAITHLAIIPDEVLDLPTELAVNFHDGPLPRYAGLNAPVWALINQEGTHGVTWHVISSAPDAGGILKQATVEIGPADTALSMNTKCLAAAAETFPELVRELAERRCTPTPQDLSQRTYYGKSTRPPAACAIDWSAPAPAIDAFVRALTYGPYPNPVGLPKTFLDADLSAPFAVTAVALAAEEEEAAEKPGTVVSITDDGVLVATGEGRIAITAARSLDGAELGPRALATAYGLAPGSELGCVGSEIGTRLTEEESALARHEDFWVRRLTAVEPPEVPQALSSGEGGARARRPLDVPREIGERFGGDAPLAVLAAFATYLARTVRKEAFTLATRASGVEGLEGWYARTVPFAVSLDPSWSVTELVDALRGEREELARRKSFLRDLVLRQPQLAARPELAGEPKLPVGVLFDGATGDDADHSAAAPAPGRLLDLEVAPDGLSASLAFDASRFSASDMDSVAAAVSTCLRSACADARRPWTALDLVPSDERTRQLADWNRTELELSAACVHRLFEQQVDRTPDHTALAFRGRELTYRQLDDRANALAHHLRALGVGPDILVGVHVSRSLELLVATLGIMKAGGAYVPLDPDFPAERIAFMLEDSGAPVVITEEALAPALPETAAAIVRIDADGPAIAKHPSARPEGGARPEHLAYAIYTSGSTGKPKGVLVEHRNVANFFAGMDAVIRHDPPGVWLAVTSLSFDISVLELFWTLARGFTVVIYKDALRASDARPEPEISSKPMAFGLFMWGNDDGPAPSKYRLMLEAARFFDRNGFDSAWTPERHFHAFGGPFPNPSVTGAALAAVTERIAIRSGSVVSPLHHPIRIAEEWAVVDNLSNGRVGLSFAAGWQPNDFILRPESYPNNKQVMLDQIDVVRRLWRGEQVEFENPKGERVAVSTLPRPVQKELPFWVTTAGNPESYRQAGRMGANVLTHLLGQSLEEVAEKIAIYREARAEAGHDPDAGVVTLMLHTFVGDDDDEVREVVRQPMKDYLGASMKLVLGFAWSFPAFKRPGGPDAQMDDVDLSSLSDDEVDAILDFAFDRYFETSGLFGTPESCIRMVERCKAIGVDEIACLLDFGVDTDAVLESLPRLKVVRDATNLVPSAAPGTAAPPTFAEEVQQHAVTHLQCTPSMARMLLDDAAARRALSDVSHLMIGGEAMTPGLAAELIGAGGASLTNMYGPTETTIWSSTQRVTSTEGPVPIGRPIANTSMYVLDRYRQPVPVGIPGDLYIGGDGVTRGYHARPELTAERFVADPFRDGGARMYWTGDLARFDADGVLHFLGRVDNQIKIRGYRIELGEIEARLERHPGVQTGVVVLREGQGGDPRLVAFIVPRGPAPDEAELREHLRAAVPEYMVPTRFVPLERMPLTPNGKIDRKALPALDEIRVSVSVEEYVEPANELERTIAGAWCTTLGLERVGVQDNFFDVGGHSLLVVQLHRTLRDLVTQPLSLVDLYRFPTIRSLTDHLQEDGSSAALEQSSDRAEKRKKAMAGRRRRRG